MAGYHACTGIPCVKCDDPMWHLRSIEVELNRAVVRETENPAAHDCYQLAIQALEPVRAAIERARQSTQHRPERGDGE